MVTALQSSDGDLLVNNFVIIRLHGRISTSGSNPQVQLFPFPYGCLYQSLKYVRSARHTAPKLKLPVPSVVPVQIKTAALQASCRDHLLVGRLEIDKSAERSIKLEL